MRAFWRESHVSHPEATRARSNATRSSLHLMHESWGESPGRSENSRVALPACGYAGKRERIFGGGEEGELPAPTAVRGRPHAWGHVWRSEARRATRAQRCETPRPTLECVGCGGRGVGGVPWRVAGRRTGTLSARLRLEHALLARADDERAPRVSALLLGDLLAPVRVHLVEVGHVLRHIDQQVHGIVHGPHDEVVEAQLLLGHLVKARLKLGSRLG